MYSVNFQNFLNLTICVNRKNLKYVLRFWGTVARCSRKLAYEKHGDTTYVKYEYDWIYDPEKKFTYPKRATIGKRSKEKPDMFRPNQNYLKYFPNAELPISDYRSTRSSCLRAGAFIVMRKIIKDYKLEEILGMYFKDRDLGLFLDLAVYSIITEDNASQYYPDYAYNHPLFIQNMKIYSDSTVSAFLQSVTEDQNAGFLNEWNGSRNHREKIYISYDSTNKNSQAGDVEIVEYGKPKVDIGFPVFNYAVGYDVNNRKTLFYEKYPGSIVDISQLKLMLNKAQGYGYFSWSGCYFKWKIWEITLDIKKQDKNDRKLDKIVDMEAMSLYNYFVFIFCEQLVGGYVVYMNDNF